MKNKKDELQNIIIGNGQVSYGNKLKKVQNFLRENASASVRAEKQKYLKSEEEDKLRAFIQEENLYYDEQILEDDFITEGAEQRVYRLDDFSVIKLNDSIFYEYWYDYFNSLLIHNYFFHTTAYQFLGFKFLNDKFLYEAQAVDSENTYEHLVSMSEEDYDWLLEDIGTSTAWMKPNP